MLKKIIISLITISALILFGCSKTKEAKNVVTVGTIAGPETQLMQVTKKVALKRYGLHVKIITFTDYNIPNQALADGQIDANAFQHIPFLLAQIKARRYKIAPDGKTFLYPMGLYSKKIKNLKQLKNGAQVAIPNDPSNEARALILLHKAGLIKLKDHLNVFATPQDITANPKQLKFVELNAAQLPRVLNDVTLAAINTTYAMPAGLSPIKDAIFHERANSLYANIIAARANMAKTKKIRELVKAYQSKPVIKAAHKLFGDGAIPAWRKNTLSVNK
jgi:D-methionine transport system substrate-binding protein